MKHTPGPWKMVDRSELNEHDYPEFWIQVDHPEYGECTHAFVHPGCDEALELGDVKANAQLIAAAPDMLQVLKIFPGLNSDTEDVVKWISYVDAVIEKATRNVEGGAAK